MALLGAPVSESNADAAAIVRTWQALVGNGWPTQQSGSNGVAWIDLDTTGRGVLRLALTNLVRDSAYGLTIFKGPYVAPGSTWSGRGVGCAGVSDGPVVRLAASKTSSAGTLDRTIALSASQMAAVNALPRRVAISVGSGSLARCGGFAIQKPAAITPAPLPSTSPSPPGPSAAPACSTWPSEIADILTILTVPDGLCLVRYPGLAEAPAFAQGGGIYFPDPPTVSYVPGVAGTEIEVLAHEVCHAHQDRVSRDAGQPSFGDGWYRTAPGVDYVQSTGWHLQGGAWVDQPEAISSNRSSPLEDNAWACALWFDPAFGPRYLRRWAPVRFAWAQRWLPLPSFIQPWTGGALAP